jgi:hypothetical protein
VPEVFEIPDVNHECYAYPEKRDPKCECFNEKEHVSFWSWMCSDGEHGMKNMQPIETNYCPLCGRKLDKKV